MKKHRYILTPAHTNSNWDRVLYALLSPESVSRALESRGLLDTYKGKIDGVIVYAVEPPVFVNGLPAHIPPPDFERDARAVIVSMTSNEVEVLPKPEQPLTYPETVAFLESGVFWSCSGKHTGEEFYCQLTWGEIEALLSESVNH